MPTKMHLVPEQLLRHIQLKCDDLGIQLAVHNILTRKLDHDRVWVCFNGVAVLRGKTMHTGGNNPWRFFVEFYKPEEQI